MAHTVNLAFVDRIDSINFVNRFNAYAAIAKNTSMENIKKINLYRVAGTNQLVLNVTDGYRISTSTFIVGARDEDFSFSYSLEPQKLPAFLERYGNMNIVVSSEGSVAFDYGENSGLVIKLNNSADEENTITRVTQDRLKYSKIVSGELNPYDNLHMFDIDYLIDALKKMKQKTRGKNTRQCVGMYFEENEYFAKQNPVFSLLILINSQGEQIDYILPVNATRNKETPYVKAYVGILKEPEEN